MNSSNDMMTDFTFSPFTPDFQIDPFDSLSDDYSSTKSMSCSSDDSDSEKRLKKLTTRLPNLPKNFHAKRKLGATQPLTSWTKTFPLLRVS
eukprot:TRINITY_DN825_c0_g2_i1.p1 TRINITY_DN825_c0_g2~~TRINITY_DN825_c0_g2_i1.p1  ORF type:complete len:91 (-),score=11.33 TRINITY_DN825_c0_g2_i1:44-316(-)